MQGDRVNKRDFIAAQLLHRAFLEFGPAARPILLAAGNPEESVDRWIREQEAEVRAMRVKLYFKVRHTPRILVNVSTLIFVLGTVDFQLGREEERLSIRADPGVYHLRRADMTSPAMQSLKAA